LDIESRENTAAVLTLESTKVTYGISNLFWNIFRFA